MSWSTALHAVVRGTFGRWILDPGFLEHLSEFWTDNHWIVIGGANDFKLRMNSILEMTWSVKEQRSRTKSIHGLLHVRECMHKISRTWDFSFQLHFGHPIVLSIKFTFVWLFFHAHVAYFIIDDGCNCKTTIIVEGLIRETVETVQIWVLWTFISSCQSISSSTHFKQNPFHPLTARPMNTENKIKHISQLIIGLLSIF